MAAPLYLTKGELRNKLLTRVGYGGLGAAAGMFVPVADDLLEEAQEQLYELFTDEHGNREWEFTTGVSQRWYDIPDTCNIDHINYIASKQSANPSDEWTPLVRGIHLAHDSVYEDTNDQPYRYDIRYNPDAGKTQIEVWPKPDKAYPMKIEGEMIIGNFVQDADRASFDSRLVLLYAVAFAKAHLNKPDAKQAMDAWTLRLRQIKANQHGTRRYFRKNPSKPRRDIRSKPKVV